MQALLLIVVLAQGVTDDSILIGMEGSAQSFSVDEENLGMRIVINHINEQGGIHGRRLVEVSYPRGTENPVDQQVANARHLLSEDDVFLLFNFGGPGSIAIAELAAEFEVPYVFPHTALISSDGKRYVFTSYPRYDDESRAMLKYLAEDRDGERIAVIHAPNVYGDYFAERALELSSAFDYVFAGAEALSRQATSAVSQMEQLRQLDPDFVIMALYPEGARRVIEAKALMDWNVRLVSSGPLSDEAYLNVEGGHAEGTLGFCHFPDPVLSDAPGIVEYRRLLQEHFPGHKPNRYSLYGYTFGTLAYVGLSKAGPELTRERFIEAMESIRNVTLHGIIPPVSFHAEDHHAQTAGIICELNNERFRPLSEWIDP